MQDVYDARLQHYLKAEIRKLPLNQQMQLKNLKMCNNTLMQQPGVQPAVFLLRNNRNEAKLFGQVTCKNPWACPHCAAVRMHQYSIEIAGAISGLWKTHRGFMVTFTIPHLRYQSCKEVTDILYNTWRDFFANAFRRRSRTSTCVQKFIKEKEIKHYVRAAEYTYGKNGWHPHFHCIFFVPIKYFNDEILTHQKELNDRWMMCAKRQMIKYWKEKNLHVDRDNHSPETRAQLLCANFNEKNPALKISEKEGKIYPTESADYILGWGADKELTGNKRKKASHEDHLTPYQILEKAADGDREMRDLYIEFCLNVTRKPVHHRVNFSKTGLKAILTNYLNSENYKATLKKKQPSWELVCWFTKQQWFDICEIDRESPFISNIMYLAAINRKDLLIDFLRSFDIELVNCAHLHGQHVLNIFNNVA